MLSFRGFVTHPTGKQVKGFGAPGQCSGWRCELCKGREKWLFVKPHDPRKSPRGGVDRGASKKKELQSRIHSSQVKTVYPGGEQSAGPPAADSSRKRWGRALSTGFSNIGAKDYFDKEPRRRG